MDFKYIPINGISLLKMKYDREVLKIVCQNNQQTQKNLAIDLSKIVKQEFSLENFPKSHNMRIKDSFQAKQISLELIINEISLNQLEFRLNIKHSAYEEFSDCIQDLINYLKREVLEKMFCDLLNN